MTEDDVVRFVTGGLSATAIAPIDHHIDACRSCRLLVSVFASQTGDRPRSRESLCAFAVGDELGGRYTVKSLLGVGGMGEVYEVHDAVLGETVALKTIAVSAALNAEGVDRFKAEVQMARRVTHPNVCRVFDVGFHVSAHRPGTREPPRIPFLTMELLRGETLRARLQRGGAMSMVDAVLLVVQIAEGLAAAHEAGITHGDLKSENVMLINDVKLGARAVLTDFGLARQVDERALRLADVDPTIAGTMGYMAPEQFRGQPATPACDIYALGVVFFEVLTGRLPYDVKALLTGQVAARWVPPPPPSLRVLGVKVPASWDDIVARCLAENPTQRFRSVRAFVDALTVALPHGRKRRHLVTAGAAILGAGLLLTAALARFGFQRTADADARPSTIEQPMAVAAPPVATPGLAPAPDATASAPAPTPPPVETTASKHAPQATQAKRPTRVPRASAAPHPPAASMSPAPGRDDVVDPFAPR